MADKNNANNTKAKPSVRKTQPRGRRSARKILDTAAALFTQKGVENTTIDEIVDQAGLSKGTFYHHYESKTALIDALRDDFMQNFEANIHEAVSACASNDYQGKLNAWICAAFDSYLHQLELTVIVFSGPEFLIWTSDGKAYMDDFIRLLEDGVHHERWHVPHPAMTANFIFRGLLGVVDDCVIQGKNAEEIRPQLAALVTSMVKENPPHSR